MAIYKALIKYGHSNFTLEILEYCDPSEILSREQHYLDLLKPSYNILKIAGSSFGYKHTDETILKLKNREITPEHKAKVWTPEHKANHLERLKTFNSSKEQKERLRAILKTLLESEGYKDGLNKTWLKRKIKVEILDTFTSERKLFDSIREAAEGIGLKANTIQAAYQSFKKKGVSSLIKKRYKVYPQGSSKKSDHTTYLQPTVEVFDSLTNQITSYLNKNQAALAIGCDPGTVLKALKKNFTWRIY